MKCPSCGAPGMKRTFSATHDPERFYLCKECGHTLSRARAPWSDRDQRFFIMARLVEEVRLLEEIRDALKERIPAEGASPISLLQEAASDRTRSKAPCRSHGSASWPSLLLRRLWMLTGRKHKPQP